MLSQTAIDWDALGFPTDPETPYSRIVPEGVVLYAGGLNDDNAKAFLARLPGPPTLLFRDKDTTYSAYRLPLEHEALNADLIPSGRFLRAGERFAVNTIEHGHCRVQSCGDLGELTVQDGLAVRSLPRPVNTPLNAFSLQGHAEELESEVQQTTPLLGNLCHFGQATVLYAPPNAGKTLLVMRLLLDAVHARRVQPANVFYVNADDSNEGLVTKLRLLQDAGMHLLAPGHKGFETGSFSSLLKESIASGNAKGMVIILDTLKKFVDLMNKAQASEMADVCRRFVMTGGTIVALAHTNKNRTAAGKLMYGGTADILQDFDAGYLLTPSDGDTCEQVVEVEALKRRGCGVEKTAYRYSKVDGLEYDELLASVEEVPQGWLEDHLYGAFERESAEVIAGIKHAIVSGVNHKMALVHSVSRRLGVSQRAVLKVLREFTGTTPDRHHWTFAVKARGANVFTLLPRPEAAGGGQDSRIAALQAGGDAAADALSCEPEFLKI